MPFYTNNTGWAGSGEKPNDAAASPDTNAAGPLRLQGVLGRAPKTNQQRQVKAHANRPLRLRGVLAVEG